MEHVDGEQRVGREQISPWPPKEREADLAGEDYFGAATGCLNRLFALRGARVDVRRRAAIAKSRWRREDSPAVLTADNAVIASGPFVPRKSQMPAEHRGLRVVTVRKPDQSHDSRIWIRSPDGMEKFCHLSGKRHRRHEFAPTGLQLKCPGDQLDRFCDSVADSRQPR